MHYYKHLPWGWLHCEGCGGELSKIREELEKLTSLVPDPDSMGHNSSTFSVHVLLLPFSWTEFPNDDKVRLDDHYGSSYHNILQIIHSQSLPLPSHLQWPLSWQLEVPRGPVLSLGTESSPYPSVPIQASRVTFALEISLDRDYFLWYLHDGFGPGACSVSSLPPHCHYIRAITIQQNFRGLCRGTRLL